jgi:quercetin dioxygenase-like cupin family protein/DNA-binding XRE family transcriptional regulator
MGLVQLGEKTGLSPALLSKLENNKLVPTVPTLLRIALVFEVTLDHFFQNEHRQRVISITRKEQRDRTDTSHTTENIGYDLARLDLGPGERKFDPYLAEFTSASEAPGKAHSHQGFEFIHVLRGKLRLTIGTEENILGPGDSIYFDSNLRHSYSRLSEDRCSAFMVFAQPERNVAERRMDRLDGPHSGRRHALPSNLNELRLAEQAAKNGNGLSARSAGVQSGRKQPGAPVGETRPLHSPPLRTRAGAA